MVNTLPRSLADWMFPFFSCFTGATWKHVLVLVAGALLSPGRRSVTAALRGMDLDQTASFAVYHRVLGDAFWSAGFWRNCYCALLHPRTTCIVSSAYVSIR